MICPNCKCEYIRGVTHCAECDVPLVDRLDPEKPRLADDVRLVAIWRGAESAERDEVGKALEGADIPFTFADARSLFFRSNETTTLEVWVSQEDRERASRVVADLEDRLYPEEPLPEEDAALALSESNEPDSDEQASSSSDLSEHWYDDDPVAEVWNGEDEDLADTLTVCLREIGIASKKLSEASHWRLLVREQHEARAKEVVREVVEASPPE